MPRMVMWSGTGKRLGEVANGIRLADGTVSLALRRGLLQRSRRQNYAPNGLVRPPIAGASALLPWSGAQGTGLAACGDARLRVAARPGRRLT
jgi:hypothetical protein